MCCQDGVQGCRGRVGVPREGVGGSGSGDGPTVGRACPGHVLVLGLPAEQALTLRVL